MKIKARALLKGLGTFVPFFSGFANRTTGGTLSSRYCYSVWMRHLRLVAAAGPFRMPHCVAELGPGDSLGIGLSALLSGINCYFALDRKDHASLKNNLAILDELVELFRQKEPIPDDVEFPGVFPKLDSYDFPGDILNDGWLTHCLTPERLVSIRRGLEGSAAPDEVVTLRYFAPWDDSAAILPESVDWIFSQAVLEHVDFPAEAYLSLWKWLRPGGLMSHAIDYGSHGLSGDWDGHRTAGDFIWHLVRGRRPYLINRYLHSAQVEMLSASGFRLLSETRLAAPSLPRAQLARGFRELSDEDLTTRGVFIVAEKSSLPEPERAPCSG